MPIVIFGLVYIIFASLFGALRMYPIETLTVFGLIALGIAIIYFMSLFYYFIPLCDKFEEEIRAGQNESLGAQ